jgi:hypothetical protein
MLVPGLVIFLAVMRSSDTVGVRGKVVELGSSLVPIVSASPASVAHQSLLYEIKLNCTMLLSLVPCCLGIRHLQALQTRYAAT